MINSDKFYFLMVLFAVSIFFNVNSYMDLDIANARLVIAHETIEVQSELNKIKDEYVIEMTGIARKAISLGEEAAAELRRCQETKTK